MLLFILGQSFAAAVSRLNAGDNKVKVWREYRAMTNDTGRTGKKTGLAQSYIGQIETSKRVGTVIVINLEKSVEHGFFTKQ